MNPNDIDIWDVNSKVAGVTFENRQETLKSLQKTGEWRKINLIYTTFNNAPAIKVKDQQSGEILGWIPKKNIQEIMKYKITKMTGWIGMYENTYYCCLFVPVKPTRTQYYKVKELCQKNNRPMPIYDIRPYTLELRDYGAD